MKDIRKKGLLSCAFVMTVILVMTGTGCRSGGDKDKKEEMLKPYLAGEAYKWSMGAASALGRLSEGLYSLKEEVLSMIITKKMEFERENWDGKNGETPHYIHQSDAPQVFFSEVKENSIPGELAEYLVEALEGEKLVESLQEIEAEYELLGEEEKQIFDLPENRQGEGLAWYYSYVKDDNWYRVSLTKDGDDIIVEHVGTRDGCTVNYIFWNCEGKHTYREIPMRAGGQVGSRPYFIEWDGENYLAIPYWDREGETIIGVTVYKYRYGYEGEVLAVGKNSDSSICVIPQITDGGYKFYDFPYNATEWPIVVRY